MIDFTDFPRRNKAYAGANGSKIAVIYNDSIYMLKFPAPPSLNKEMSYANGCVSEYLGSHIFNMLGIPAQDTVLGTFRKNGRERVIVACRDFSTPDTVLQDFASLKNTVIDSGHNGYGTELTEILEAIEDQQAIDPGLVVRRFWDMFVVDAFIGNWDRHNGNWGFLYNVRTDEMTLAPVYDCGSSLYPQADEKIMRRTLEIRSERDYRIFEIPTSGIRSGGRKIKYFDFMSSLQNRDCNDALKRIVPRIDMSRIRALIDNTPYISDLQKDFYKMILSERKEKILDYSLQILKRRERSSDMER